MKKFMMSVFVLLFLFGCVGGGSLLFSGCGQTQSEPGEQTPGDDTPTTPEEPENPENPENPDGGDGDSETGANFAVTIKIYTYLISGNGSTLSCGTSNIGNFNVYWRNENSGSETWGKNGVSATVSNGETMGGDTSKSGSSVTNISSFSYSYNDGWVNQRRYMAVFTKSVSGYTYCGYTQTTPTTSYGITSASPGFFYIVHDGITTSSATAESKANDKKTITQTVYLVYRQHYKITYNGNGGTDSSAIIPAGANYTLPKSTKEGYTFTGWQSGSTTKNAGDKISCVGAKTWTAQWSANQQTLTINPNGGYYNGTSDTTQVKRGTDSTYTLGWPGRDGYNFTGWTKSGNGTLSGNTYTFGPGDGTVTANWSLATYTLKFDPNGGTCYDTTAVSSRCYNINAASYISGAPYSVITSLPTPTRTGYTFVNWKETNVSVPGSFGALGGSGPYDGGMSLSGCWGSVTLQAQWSINSYTVTINPNGGSVSPTSRTQEYGSTYTLPTPSRTGYTFTSWSHTSGYGSLSGSTYTFGAGNGTVTANWTPTPYTVTFNPNGGTFNGTTSTSTVDYNINTNATLGAPTRTGYSFSCWRVTTGDGNWPQGADYYGSTKYLNGYGNPTLTAEWSVNSYTLTYHPNYGSGAGSTQSVSYASTFPVRTDSQASIGTRTGYTFAGWGTSASSGVDSRFPAGGTSTVTYGSVWGASSGTLYAQWEINVYSININIVNPSGGEPCDGSAGYMTLYYDVNNTTYSHIVDQPGVATPYFSGILISNIEPGTGMKLSSVSAGYDIINNGNDTWTYVVRCGGGTPSGGFDDTITIQMAWEASAAVNMQVYVKTLGADTWTQPNGRFGGTVTIESANRNTATTSAGGTSTGYYSFTTTGNPMPYVIWGYQATISVQNGTDWNGRNCQFVGFTTGSTPPAGNAASSMEISFTPGRNSTTTYYLWFVEVSDNQMLYDPIEDVHYFESGEYPQDAARDELVMTLANYDSTTRIWSLNGTITTHEATAFDINFVEGEVYILKMSLVSGSIENAGNAAFVMDVIAGDWNVDFSSRYSCAEISIGALSSTTREASFTVSAKSAADGKKLFIWYAGNGSTVTYNNAQIKIEIYRDYNAVLENILSSTNDMEAAGSFAYVDDNGEDQRVPLYSYNGKKYARVTAGNGTTKWFKVQPIRWRVNESIKTFNGTSDFVNLGRKYMYEDRLTANLWAYRDSWSSADQMLISCWEGGGYGISLRETGPYFSVYDNGVGYKDFVSSTAWSSMSAGWHMFTLTFDGAYVRGYVDGVLAGTTAKFTSGKIGYHPSNSVFVGAESSGSATTPDGAYFQGKIKNVRILNQAYDAQEILSLFTTGGLEKGYEGFANIGDYNQDFTVVSDKVIGFGAINAANAKEGFNFADSSMAKNVASNATIGASYASERVITIKGGFAAAGTQKVVDTSWTMKVYGMDEHYSQSGATFNVSSPSGNSFSWFNFYGKNSGTEGYFGSQIGTYSSDMPGSTASKTVTFTKQTGDTEIWCRFNGNAHDCYVHFDISHLANGTYSFQVRVNGAEYNSDERLVRGSFTFLNSTTGNVRVASMEEINSTFEDTRAKATDFVAFLSSWGANSLGGTYADYWTSSLGNQLDTARTVTSWGAESQEWLQNAKGFRLSMTMSEGNNNGGSAMRYIRVSMDGSNENSSDHLINLAVNTAGGSQVVLVDAPNNAGVENFVSGYLNAHAGQYYDVLTVSVLDLGKTVAAKSVWMRRYYSDARHYYGTHLEGSVDGVNWFNIWNSYNTGSYGNDLTYNTYTETAEGRTFEIPYSDGSLLDMNDLMSWFNWQDATKETDSANIIPIVKNADGSYTWCGPSGHCSATSTGYRYKQGEQINLKPGLYRMSYHATTSTTNTTTGILPNNKNGGWIWSEDCLVHSGRTEYSYTFVVDENFGWFSLPWSYGDRTTFSNIKLEYISGGGNLSSNSVTFTTVGGWEIIGQEVAVTPNTNYTLSVDYVAPDHGKYGEVVQVLSAAPANDGNESTRLATYDLVQNTRGHMEVTFNTGSNSTVWVVLNGGYLNDDQIVTFSFTNWSLTTSGSRAPGFESNMRKWTKYHYPDNVEVDKNLYNPANIMSPYLLTFDSTSDIFSINHTNTTSGLQWANFFYPYAASPYMKPNTTYTVVVEAFGVQSGGKIVFMSPGDEGRDYPTDVGPSLSFVISENGVYSQTFTTYSDFSQTVYNYRSYIPIGAGQTVNMHFRISVFEGTPYIDQSFQYNKAGGGIPSGYSQLDYIESTGTQYIDTGWVPNGSSGFYADFEIFNAISSSDCGYVFGSRENWQSRRFQLNTYPSFSGGQFGYSSSTNLNPEITVGTRVQVGLIGNTFTSAKNNITTISREDFSGATNLYLFTRNDISGVNEFARMKLYGFKLYDNTHLVRDFIPCVRNSDGAVGLYDRVSGQFFGNAGSGEFIAGGG